ncbi:MAG: hypothetical protein K5990_06830 [Oscillospiraceae bacterium]|nr:hypothetical protein [Oscillospiraceae bacterium]
MRKTIIVGLLGLGLTLLLAACGSEQTGTAASEALYDVPGLEAVAPPPTEVPVTEPPSPPQPGELYGSYYNDYLRLTLTLDPDGAARLTGGAEERTGTYTQTEEGLSLTLAGEDLSVETDADGDLTLGGLSGYFLRDWDFWGITPEEVAGPEPEPDLSERGELRDNGDGTLRFLDYTAGVAMSFPAGMEVLVQTPEGAAVVSDGAGGCVIGRNVTALREQSNLWLVSSSSATEKEEFLADCIHDLVLPDLAALHGKILSYANLSLGREPLEGRLADARMRVNAQDGSYDLLVMCYLSTYADGTVAYICKTVACPVGGAQTVDELAAAVRDVGAVRLVAEE